MNYITIENVTRTYGEKVLFKNITFYIGKGQKAALIAKNGTGKSTLMRILTGKEQPEGPEGKIIVHKGIRVSYLEQEPAFNDAHNVLEAAFSGDHPAINAIRGYEKALLHPENETALQAAITEMDDQKAWDQEARCKEILSKLNINFFERNVNELSGGQRKRLALARILIEEPDLLILDEPTNHLDLDMIEWLEKYLQQTNLTLFLVTHDRYFLQSVCNVIYEMERGNLYKYTGTYSDYLDKKALREENEAANLDKNKNIMRRELEWMRRQPKARGTKAKSRIDDFYELEEKTKVKINQEAVEIMVKTERMGSKILEAHNISKSFGGQKIIERFDYKFKRKDRVGIIGPNGTGKSTFLNILTGGMPPDSGKIVIGDTVVFGYYTQSGMNLAEDKRVIEVITDIAEFIPLEKGRKMTAAQLLEKFLFSRGQQQVYVSQLSGGERRRLYMLTILMNNPNFLILDEPTNDLDIVTLNVLEDFLEDFPGCLLIVSHDRYFMDKLVEHLFVFEGDGIISDFPGNYTDYRASLDSIAAVQNTKTQESKEPVASIAPKDTLSYDERKEIKRIENELKKLEDKKSEITNKFNDAGISPAEIEKLSNELGLINEQIESKEFRWMELAEKAG